MPNVRYLNVLMPRCEISVAGSCQRVKKIITRLILIQSFKIVSRFEAEIHQKKIPYKVYGDIFLGVGVSSQKTEKS